MGRVGRLLRSIPRIRRSFAPVLLSFLVLWCSSTVIWARTEAGVQCPTAKVQTILEPVRDCCGHVIGTVVRKPKPGEAGFLQCRCAEKRSAQQQTDIDKAGPHVEMLPSGALVLELPFPPEQARKIHSTIARLVGVPSPPIVPPPAPTS